MLYLGIALAVCFVPGYTGATIPSQWALLSCVLPFSLWRKAEIGAAHWLGLMFVVWAILSTAWATNYHTSVFGLWIVSIWGLSFWLGSSLQSLAQLWKGLAIGLSISSIVAMAQALGFHPVEIAEAGRFPGLLFNTTVQGATIALVLIALVSHRLWWYTPLLWVGLALSQSKGAALVLAAALIARFTHWLFALALLVAGALAFTFLLDSADSQRLQIWGYAIRGLSLLGWGPDSFSDIYFSWYDPGLAKRWLMHAEFVHNDYLQLWFEYGLGALAIFALFGLALAETENADWPVAFGFAILATFYFPLYLPIPAFIGCVVAGHLTRPRLSHGVVRDSRRFDLLPRHALVESIFNHDRGEVIPLVTRTAHSEA